MLQSIFAGEYKKIDRKLVVEREAVRILLQYDCPGNIGQMQSDIQVCCANAFLESVSKQQDTVYIRCRTGAAVDLGRQPDPFAGSGKLL